LAHTFFIPGTAAPEITVRQSFFTGLKVLVDGRPVKRTARNPQTYRIPLPDGSTTDLQLFELYRGLRARVNGVDIQLERRLAGWEIALVSAPLLLLAGGVIGGLIGGIAWFLNLEVARSLPSAQLRIGAIIGVTFLAIVTYLAVRTLLLR